MRVNSTRAPSRPPLPAQWRTKRVWAGPPRAPTGPREAHVEVPPPEGGKACSRHTHARITPRGPGPLSLSPNEDKPPAAASRTTRGGPAPANTHAPQTPPPREDPTPPLAARASPPAQRTRAGRQHLTPAPSRPQRTRTGDHTARCTTPGGRGQGPWEKMPRRGRRGARAWGRAGDVDVTSAGRCWQPQVATGITGRANGAEHNRTHVNAPPHPKPTQAQRGF